MVKCRWLMIFSLVSLTYSYRLQCPDFSQRTLRALGYCTGSLGSRYTCLYDTNKLSFTEQCNRNPDFVTPGEKYVLTGNLRNIDCPAELYQPFRLWSNVSGECLNQKSLCEGEGQIIFNNGSLIGDRTCRCDYTKGYKFIKQPKQNCFCNPSIEDCSCHITKCPDGLILLSDYQCVEEKHHADSKCPPIEIIERGILQRQNIQSYTDNRKQLRISLITVSIMLLLVLAYTVILFSFWDKISEIEFTKGLNNQKEKPKQRSNLKNDLNDPSTYDGRINSSNSISADKSQENNTLEKLIGQDKHQHDKSHKQQNNNEEEISRIKEALTTMNENLQRDLFVNKQERETLKQQLKSAEDKEQTRITLQLKQDSILQEKDTEIKRLKQLLNIKNTEIENKNCDIRLHETERRKYHNRIQELKGNIRVFCRVRPLLGSETNEVISFPDHDREQKIIKLHKTEDAKLKAGKHAITDHVFEFDKVFRGNAKQHQVFEELSQLVQSALDGYNVCIFAYGQTGSGKTYTMEGVSNDEIVNKGMIPRAVLHILDKTKEIESIGWKYILKMSFLEIYNETIRDLLGNEELKHDINMSDKGLYVSNLTVEPFTEETKVYNLLQRASNKRSVGKTTGNERSSRSHSVLTLQLIGNNSITDEKSNGTLNMVDLAGSESIDSEATPQRQEETKAINKSLSTLGNVIMALGNGAGHIPYRDSKLTKLLQNSLGGNSKTLMFVNVSPTKKCAKESLTSLRFAEKVNQCTIGIATKTQ